MAEFRNWIGLALLVFGGCSEGPREDQSTVGVPTSVNPSSAGTTSGSSSGSDVDDDDGILDLGKLDAPPSSPTGGCEAIDFLFVVDNSESMATYQAGLAAQFPDFITSMYSALPESVSVHVGLTTTDFDAGCAAAEATQSCQTAASLDEVEAHYLRPDETNDAGNGTQGRLFEFGGRNYFESNSDDDPSALSAWFSDAAVAAGEAGCSFEMPVAAAGFAAHPSNAPTNEGFIRDAGGLLVLFFLTDEPDKSVESRFVYEEMLLDAKADCGGADCIFVSGLIPECTIDVNQKLWQFIQLFEEEPRWGDIEQTNDYTEVFGDTLADAIAEACFNLPEG